MSHDSENDLTLQPSLWALCGSHPLQAQPWTRDWSVFNPETGETHLISELPAATLRLLAKDSQPLAHFAADLAKECGVEMSTAWEKKVAGVLTDLEQIELVEQVHTEQH